MKIASIFILGVATGWFLLMAIQSKLDRIYDWRPFAGWAVASALCAAGVNYVF